MTSVKCYGKVVPFGLQYDDHCKDCAARYRDSTGGTRTVERGNDKCLLKEEKNEVSMGKPT